MQTFIVTLFKKILEIIRMKISQILEDQLAGTLQDSQLFLIVTLK